ncbi:MAG: DUF4469 domain-containing protein [Tannerella sp.]|jgi:hypothetical protein|nr:DUF4469 domain-containing protein [Tannerella sp.]
MAKLFKIFVELYELLLTARKDDRSGRAVSTGSMKVDDLIAIASTRRSDINPATMKASYEILHEVALEEVCRSKSVEFGLTHNKIGVEGVFIGDHPTWDSSKNHLFLLSTATAEVRKALKDISVEVLGMSSSGIFINSLTDVTSGEVNTRITPGGGVNLTGSKIRIAGDAPGVGIYLADLKTGSTTAIPATSILVNDPSKITFIVPPDLPSGDYRLSITTQFSSNVLLNEPRTGVLDYVLACG